MVEQANVTRAVFYGLGADGTVGANKNSVKIIAEDAGLYAQGYFVYDSHKSGAQTISHLRFGPEPIHAPYLITQASFVACHQFVALQRQDLLDVAAPGATVLLNVPWPAAEVWDRLPRPVQETIVGRKLRLFVIDASAVAREVGLGSRTNTVLQTCFFAISGVLPHDKAIGHIKDAIRRDLRTEGPDGHRPELRGGRWHPGAIERSESSGPRHRLPGDACVGAGQRTGLRPLRHRASVRRTWRSNSGQCDTGRRHVSVGHGGVRKAQHFGQRSGLARRSLRPVWTMQLRLSAQCDPVEILSRGPVGRGSGRFQIRAR